MKDKQDFLVIVDHDSGIAQLSNVLVVAATDAQEAKEVACQRSGFVPQASYNMKATPISDLGDGWQYYY